MELELLNEYRFYKLVAKFPQKCFNLVDNIYSIHEHLPDKRVCGGLLWLNMINDGVNMICKHVGCFKQYEITRECNICGLVTPFEDTTCDNCEPRVIDIATWSISIAEAFKAIKKVNSIFKNNLIEEKEWRVIIQINKEEIIKCEKLLEENLQAYMS